jgi:hypothetical protein
MLEEGYTVPASRTNTLNNSKLPLHVRKVIEQTPNAYLYAPLDHFDQDKHIEGWKTHLQKKPQKIKTKRNYTRSFFRNKEKRRLQTMAY